MNLTKGQQDVMASEGHLLVTGGPGSGKTTFTQALVDQYVNLKKIVKTIENLLFTLEAKLFNPLVFETTTTPKIGKTIAVKLKPTIAITVLLPACCPRKGGNIKLPAPKNNENNIIPTNNTSLFFNSLFITTSIK